MKPYYWAIYFVDDGLTHLTWTYDILPDTVTLDRTCMLNTYCDSEFRYENVRVALGAPLTCLQCLMSQGGTYFVLARTD